MHGLTSEERAYVRQFLINHFNLSELKALAFDLGVNYEIFPHGTVSDLALGLIGFFERRTGLPCLIEQILRERQSEELAQLLGKLPGCQPRKKVQIILSGHKLIDENEILPKLANLLGVEKNEVMLIGTLPGSIRLLVSVPAIAASKLFTEEHRYVDNNARELVPMSEFVALEINKTNSNNQIISIDDYDSLENDLQRLWLATTVSPYRRSLYIWKRKLHVWFLVYIGRRGVRLLKVLIFIIVTAYLLSMFLDGVFVIWFVLISSLIALLWISWSRNQPY